MPRKKGSSPAFPQRNGLCWAGLAQRECSLMCNGGCPLRPLASPQIAPIAPALPHGSPSSQHSTAVALPGCSADCTDDISDCTLAERDSLRDWQGRLYSKYPIVGEVVKEGAAAAAGEPAGAAQAAAAKAVE